MAVVKCERMDNNLVVKFAYSFGLNVVDCRVFLELCKRRLFVNSHMIAVYCLVDDDTLAMIQYGLIDLTCGEEVLRLLSMDGENVHFLGVVGDFKGLLGLRNFKCKSISWFTPDMSKFVFFKRR